MWITLVLLSGLAGALCAPANPSIRAVSMDTIISDFFRQGDKDNDGIYSLTEAWAEILAMDRDGDKKVSLSEYTARLHSIEPTMVPEAPRFFAKEDMDKDGYIDQQDVNKVYAVVDTDGNGQVTMSEFSVFVKQFFVELGFGTTGPTPTGPTPTGLMTTPSPDSRTAALFKFADKNGNGAVSLDEEWADILVLDTNGDHEITFGEYYAHVRNATNDTRLWARIGLDFDLADYDRSGIFNMTDLVHAFNESDHNGDGHLSLSEYIEYNKPLSGYISTPDGMTTSALDKELLERFHWIDRNGDGFVTVDEQWANMLRMDLNGDNRISLGEYAGVINGTESEAEIRKQLSNSDFNNNGYFDRSDAEQNLKQADLNGDGQMSLSEYIQHNRAFLQQPTPPVPTGSTRSPDTVYNRIFNSIDTDGSGKLNSDEVWAAFLTADYDGDGRVSWAEFMKNETNDPSVLARAQAIFHHNDYDRNEFLEQADARRGLAEIDTDGDGEISESEYINHSKQLLANLGIAVEGFTPAPGSLVPLDLALEKAFKDVDADGNGTISFDEQWAAILRFDLDGDGRVNLEEYLANTTGEGVTFDQAIFKEFDYDNNGYFDVSDIRLGFATLDSDGDGHLSHDEYVGFLKQFLTNLGVVIEGYTAAPSSNVSLESALIQSFNEVDADGNGFISFDEQWARVILLDKDGDNKVSLSEYLASFANSSAEASAYGRLIFQQFDYNHDGYFEGSDIREGIRFLDYNDDGNVDQTEYVGYLKRFYKQITVSSISVSPSPTPSTPTP